MSEPTDAFDAANVPQPVTHPTEQSQDGVQPSIWRVKLISFCLLIGWGIMVARLIHLQGAQRQLLNTKVNRQSTFTEKVPARPGEVLDRNGHVLAMTITRESLYAVPAEISDAGNFVWEVSQILDINADELYDRIAKHPDRQSGSTHSPT